MEESLKNNTVLIVDDTKTNIDILGDALKPLHKISVALDGKSAISLAEKICPDLILLDIMMPGLDGFEVTRRLKSDPETFKIPIIAVTALHDRRSNVKAIEAGVDGFLTKPIDEVLLSAHIAGFLKAIRLDRELQVSQKRLNIIGEYHRRLTPGRSSTRALIGKSRLIEKVRDRIDMVKSVQVPVLVLGQSGTGKQLVAEAIHWEGDRASEPFIQINCAGLQENLLESELFGHARGAFTGAAEHKKGLIEVAEKGTLFVDEVGDMSLAVQAKLLTVLDSGLFRRLGETQDRKADVRIIAATNHDLDKQIKKGRFRADLFYRLNVFDITLPPLRMRKEDTSLLANYFLSRSTLANSSGKTFAADAVDAFQKYDWPGNVRELSNVVDRAIVLSGPDDNICFQHLPPELTRSGDASKTARHPAPSGMTLREVEIAYIKAMLKKEKGNRTRAARELGIARSTLKKKIAANRSLREFVE